MSVRYTLNHTQDTCASVLSIFASNDKNHSSQTIHVGVNTVTVFNITAGTNTLLTVKAVCGKSGET